MPVLERLEVGDLVSISKAFEEEYDLSPQEYGYMVVLDVKKTSEIYTFSFTRNEELLWQDSVKNLFIVCKGK